MADIEHSITVSSNLVEVYKAVTAYDDADSIKEWQTSIKSLGVTAGSPLRTGSMIAMKRQFIMSEVFMNVDVTDLQRNKRFDLQGIHGRFSFRREIEFSPSGRETVIKDRIWLKTGILFFWWRPFVLAALKGQISKEWASLKQLMDK